MVLGGRLGADMLKRQAGPKKINGQLRVGWWESRLTRSPNRFQNRLRRRVKSFVRYDTGERNGTRVRRSGLGVRGQQERQGGPHAAV